MVERVSAAALEVHDLVKSYRRIRAVRGISFSAQFGEITAVLGPNGAGKTTTIECCEGLREPDGGAIKILGHDPHTAPSDVRSRIGVMLQDGGLPMAVPAGSILRHVGRLYGDLGRKRELELIDRLELRSHLRTPVRRLSGGNRQRLALACALIGDPDVLFLDEPTAGMDPHARVAVHNFIQEMKERGTAIILTTHLLDEAEALADQVILMASGAIQSAGTVAEITADNQEGIEIIFDAAVESAVLRPGLGTEYALEPAGGRTEVATGQAETATARTQAVPGHPEPGSCKAWHIRPAPGPAAFARLAAHVAHAGLEIKEMRQLTDLTSLFLRLAENADNEGRE